jgi:hypothetical protein
VKTATLDVGGMLSMLDYRGVEKQLGRITGARRATGATSWQNSSAASNRQRHCSSPNTKGAARFTTP